MCSQRTYMASDLLHLTVFNKINGKIPQSETIIKVLPCIKMTNVTLSLSIINVIYTYGRIYTSVQEHKSVKTNPACRLPLP